MDKTETNDLLEECMLYFKARPVYKKLFLKMRDKYAGLGHFGGTAMLTSLSREEKSQLGGFFQKMCIRDRRYISPFSGSRKASAR